MGLVQVGRKGTRVMKVLVVCRYKENCVDNIAPFVGEQVDALWDQGVEYQLFRVYGKGIRGYLEQLKSLKKAIKAFRPDVIHAHYGLCGLLANLQRKIPVVTTYHGSDINDPEVYRFSKKAMLLSSWNVFVSKKTLDIAKPKRRFTLQPCGIDLSDLQLTSKNEARQRMHLDEGKKYVLFSGAFDNAVKNASLAFEAVEMLQNPEVDLIELKGYSREEVTLLMCAADSLLMTSFNEGSPQVIKEAMACGCPIVSVDVGDVRERTIGVEGCYVAETRVPKELADLLSKALAFEGKTQGREKIIADGLDNRQVAAKLMEMYKACLK